MINKINNFPRPQNGEEDRRGELGEDLVSELRDMETEARRLGSDRTEDLARRLMLSPAIGLDIFRST